MASKRPNILFLFPDQHRFDWLETNPDLPLRTPNLTRLSERGVRFTNAITPSPLCAPARACLAAGREYERCGVPSNRQDYPISQPTFYAQLRDAGYHVTGCGKFDLHKASPSWGVEGKRLLTAWGFSDGIDNAGKWDAVNSGATAPKDPYMAYLHENDLAETHLTDMRRRRGNKAATFPTLLPEEAYCDNWVGHNGLKLMARCPKGQPWFLQVNFTGPHDPWDITARMEQRWRGVDFPLPNGNDQLTAEQHVAIRQNYAAMVENIDRWVGIYVDELKRRGQLDNTLIVYSSDHGEMLGDHNRWAKGVPYQPSLGVPLIIAGPGVCEGILSDALVSLIDLTATFLEYGGIAILEGIEGRSLRPLLEGQTNVHRPYVSSSLGGWCAVFDGRHKLIQGFGEETQLFDLQRDPLENENLTHREKTVVERLSRLF